MKPFKRLAGYSLSVQHTTTSYVLYAKIFPYVTCRYILGHFVSSRWLSVCYHYSTNNFVAVLFPAF